MSYHLGVDLGTTYTAVAVHHDGHPEIVCLGTRAASVPTVVFLRDDEVVLTGDAANRRAVAEPGRVAREFKRRLGDPTPILLGGAPYSPEALMAELLRSVVDTVAERQGGPPDAITLTHPANWGPFKLDVLAQTVRLAGLSEVATLSEPEAAAIHYSSTARVEAGEVVAVYDLGGGTFDAAVLRKGPGGFEILGAPEGIDRLGGVDFDQAVFGFVVRALNGALDALDAEDPATLAALARLRQECVEAKEALSGDSHATVPVLLPGLQSEVRITRAELEAMIRPPIGETVRALRRVLDTAGVATEEIKAVLLVGGSSRIPLVAELVEAEVGRPVAVDVHPKHAVALGAALHAGGRSGAVLDGAAAVPAELQAVGEEPPIPEPVAIGDAEPGAGDGDGHGVDELRPAALARTPSAVAPDDAVAPPWPIGGEWGAERVPLVTTVVELPPPREALAPSTRVAERPREWGAPLPPAPAVAAPRTAASPSRRRGPMIVAAAVVLVVVLVVGGLLLRSTSSPGSDPAADLPVRYAFTPVALESGLVVARTWELSPGDGDQFHAVVRLTNGSDVAVSDRYDEVIPKSLAASVDAIRFSPAFDEVVQADPIVRYRFDALPPGEAFVFSYDIDVPAEGAHLERLLAWARDREVAAASRPVDNPVVRTLGSLAIVPDRVELSEGDRFGLQLTGEMDDGSPAPPAVLEAVVWSSQNPNIVVVDDAGVLQARQPGGTAVAAQAGDLVHRAVVAVTRRAAPGAGGGDPDDARRPAPRGDDGTGPPAPPPVACADRIDNDGDGRADLADPGCSSLRDGDETDLPPPPAVCADGRDNDGDGRVDLDDRGCASPADRDETDLRPPPACADGRDNDGDGKTDLADPGCSSPTDVDETDPPACADGRDNDGDGKTDHGADPGCSSPADGDETDPPACADGRDNDGDGLSDFAGNDPGCSSPADDDEADPVTEPTPA